MTYVLASLDPPSICKFYPSIEAAAAHRQDADEFNMSQQRFRIPPRHFALMTFADYLGKERAFFLGQLEEAISQERFEALLEVMPPMAWEQHEQWESFLLMEYLHEPHYTTQVVRLGIGEDARFFTKTVDATDPSTWFTHIPAAFEADGVD